MEMAILTHSLRVEPYPYQREGILFGLRRKRFIIGDEPGLGKTLQSIGVADCAGAYPCLVICPASLKINWQREFEKFTSVKALILDNSNITTWPYLMRMGLFQVAIVNYESLRKFFVWDLRRRPFRLKDVVFSPDVQLFRSVIIDESHRVKDPAAQQTILTKGITTGKPYVMLLSGTPVVNRPEDLIAQLSIMDRLQEFGGRQEFLDRYCGEEKPQRRGDTPVREGYAHLDELSQRLYESCLIRREKDKVLTQLPPKTRIDLHLDLADRTEYDAAAIDLADYLRRYTQATEADVRRKMRMEALVKFMTLRALAAKAKVPQAIDFIRSFLESGRQLIIFCSLHEIVDALHRSFPKAVTITGRDSLAAKQAAVDAFQASQASLAICSIKAAGVGLTLTASSTVMFIEFPWTYADCCQCEDRAHRIGQRDNVTCYYMLARNTIDTVLYSIIQAKKSIAAQIMASSDDIPQDEAYFDELMNSFLNAL